MGMPAVVKTQGEQVAAHRNRTVLYRELDLSDSSQPGVGGAAWTCMDCRPRSQTDDCNNDDHQTHNDAWSLVTYINLVRTSGTPWLTALCPVAPEQAPKRPLSPFLSWQVLVGAFAVGQLGANPHLKGFGTYISKYRTVLTYTTWYIYGIYTMYIYYIYTTLDGRPLGGLSDR